MDMAERLRLLHRRYLLRLGERHTCPYHRDPLRPDRWAHGRWTRLGMLIARWRNPYAWGRRLERLRRTLFGTALGGEQWPPGEPKPRSCSYCGSAHPEDVILLHRRGWVAFQGRGKTYIEPPESLVRPVPPVKMNAAHANPFIDRLNASMGEFRFTDSLPKRAADDDLTVH